MARSLQRPRQSWETHALRSPEELKPGLRVVIVSGGSFYHEAYEVLSKPYTKRSKVSGPYRGRGKPEEKVVERYVVKLRSLGKAAGTEISARGQGGGYEEEYLLSGMGLCPDDDGQWSLSYTVPADKYRAKDH